MICVDKSLALQRCHTSAIQMENITQRADAAQSDKHHISARTAGSTP